MGTGVRMRLLCLIVALLWCGPAHADLRITRDFGGFVDQYKTKYAKVRAKGERVIIDGRQMQRRDVARRHLEALGFER